MTNDVYVIDAVRTPIGRYGGALADTRPDDLAAHASAASRNAPAPWTPPGSMMSSWARPTAPVRTTATSRGWQFSLRVCRSQCRASRLTGSAAPGWKRPSWLRGQSRPTTHRSA